MELSNYQKVSFRDATIEDSSFIRARLLTVNFNGTKIINSNINGKEYSGNSNEPESQFNNFNYEEVENDEDDDDIDIEDE